MTWDILPEWTERKEGEVRTDDGKKSMGRRHQPNDERLYVLSQALKDYHDGLLLEYEGMFAFYRNDFGTVWWLFERLRK